MRGKSNAITAIPELLYRLDIAGCLVTIDAMGCQREIAAQIIDQKGDSCLALKGNQSGMHDTIRQFFERSRDRDWQFDEGVLARPIPYYYAQTTEKGHGRIETRRCFVVAAATAWLTHEQLEAWAGLSSVACVESERTIQGKTVTEQRYFLTSLQSGDTPAAVKRGQGAQGTKARPEVGATTRHIAKELLRGVRSHWGIENALHWVLDVGFREDESRVRRGNAPNNLATLRRLSVSLVRADKTIAAGVKARRLRAGWDAAYLLTLLAGQQVPDQEQDKQKQTV